MPPTAIWVRRRIAAALIGTIAAVTGVVVLVSPASGLVAQDWCELVPMWPGCHN